MNTTKTTQCILHPYLILISLQVYVIHRALKVDFKPLLSPYAYILATYFVNFILNELSIKKAESFTY